MNAVALPRPEIFDPFAAARQAFERLPEFLRSEEARRMKHSDMERELEQRGQELMRTLYQAWLDTQASAEADEAVRNAEGKERTHKRVQRRGLETVFGTVTVERTGYGAKGAASLHPLDAKLNLPEERHSHELRRRTAEEVSKSSFDETVEALARHTGARIAKRQVEELAKRAAQDFDAFYETRRQEPAVGAKGSVLVITSDGKGVVLCTEDLRPATRKAAARRQRKLDTRLSRGEKRNRKRMATVAAVYTVAPYVRTPEQVFRSLARLEGDDEDRPPRPRAQNKRVWASLEREPEEVLEEAFQEALGRNGSDEKKTWVSVVDGNEPQLAILERLAEKHDVQLTIVLDIIHVLEYLWKAGHAFEVAGTAELEQWVLERLLRILEGRASHVAAGMRRSATKRQLSKKRRRPVDTCAGYLLKYKEYLAYDQYLAAGLPIGSGVIEGACRHLVKDRMALTGARWRLAAAEAVLRLRALRSSHDFDEYWRFHEAKEYERNHRARYANGAVPETRPPQKTPRLKRIK